MGAGTVIGAHDNAQMRKAATKTKVDVNSLSKFISMKDMAVFEGEISRVAKDYIKLKEEARAQSAEKEKDLTKLKGEAAQFERIKQEIACEIESIKTEEAKVFARIDQDFQKNFMRSVKITDYIAVTGLFKKRVSAFMQSPVKALGGTGMIMLGTLSAINEMGAFMNGTGTSLPNLSIAVVGGVLVGYGLKLISKCGLVPAVMKEVMKKKPTEIQARAEGTE